MDVTIATGAAWPDHVAVLRGAEVRCYSLRDVAPRREYDPRGYVPYDKEADS